MSIVSIVSGHVPALPRLIEHCFEEAIGSNPIQNGVGAILDSSHAMDGSVPQPLRVMRKLLMTIFVFGASGTALPEAMAAPPSVMQVFKLLKINTTSTA